MLIFYLNCPWPVEHTGYFDWTKVEYQYHVNNVFIAARVKSQVTFYVDDHLQCEYILSYMQSRCDVQNYNCVVPTGAANFKHKLEVLYIIQSPVHSVPGIEPADIPFAMGDCFPCVSVSNNLRVVQQSLV